MWRQAPPEFYQGATRLVKRLARCGIPSGSFSAARFVGGIFLLQFFETPFSASELCNNGFVFRLLERALLVDVAQSALLILDLARQRYKSLVTDCQRALHRLRLSVQGVNFSVQRAEVVAKRLNLFADALERGRCGGGFRLACSKRFCQRPSGLFGDGALLLRYTLLANIVCLEHCVQFGSQITMRSGKRRLSLQRAKAWFEFR